MKLVKCGLKCELTLDEAEALDNAKNVLENIITDLGIYENENDMCEKEYQDFDYAHRLAIDAVHALADFVLECTIEA